MNYAFHEIESEEGHWNAGGRRIRTRPQAAPQGGLFPRSTHRQHAGSAHRDGADDGGAGNKVERAPPRVATGGQAEIDMRFTTLTRMADHLMIYKYVVKNTARKHGMTATFMPKPLFEDNASGMHVHQSLWKGDTQPFLQRGALCGFERARALLHRRPAEARLGALRAVRADHELVSPAGSRLRGANQPGLFTAQPLRLLRIPMYSPNPRAKRVEFRSPDPRVTAIWRSPRC